MALDNALLNGAELSLKVFQVAQEAYCLHQDNVRLFVQDLKDMPEAIKAASLGRCQRVCGLDSGSSQTALAIHWAVARRVLHCHIDQGAVGVPSKVWLFCRQRLRGWFWIDHAHRRHNCVIDAFAACGLGWLRSEMAFVSSVASGPWGNAGHFGKFSEACKEFIRNSNIHDPLWTELYPVITFFLTEAQVPSSYGQEGHMQEVWQLASESRVLEDPGEKVKLGRWFAFSRRWRVFSRTRGILLLALAYVGITLKWWKSIWDSPIASLSGKAVPPAQPPGQDDGGDPDVGHGGPPGGADAGAVVIEDPGRSVVRSSIAVEKRASTASSLKLATTILCKLPCMALSDFACALIRPIEVEHSMTIQCQKTSAGSLDWYISMATGQRQGHLGHILSCLSSQKLLVLTGILPSPSLALPSFDAATRKELLANMVSLMREVLAKEVGYLSTFQMWLPYQLAGVLSPVVEHKAAALQRCRAAWEAIVKAQRSPNKKLVEELLWPLAPWPREMLMGLWETKFTGVPDNIKGELTDAFRFAGTNHVEDMFNYMRRLLKANSQGQAGAEAMWHKSLHSPILSEADGIVIETAPQDIRAADAIPKSFFSAVSSDFSLGDATIDGFCTDSGGLTFSHNAYLQLASLQSALTSVTVEQLPKVWLSQLAVAGHAIQNIDDEERWWVLEVTQHGVLVWKLRELLRPGEADLLVPVSSSVEDAWRFLHIHDHSQWMSTPLVAKLWQPHGNRAELPTVALSTEGTDPLPLLEFAAALAFKGWTVPNLKKLVQELGLVTALEPMPSLSAQLVRLLCRRVLTSLSEEELSYILEEEKQTEKQAPVNLKTSITPDQVQFVQEVLEADAEDVEKEAAKAAGQPSKKARTTPPAQASSSSSSAQPASAPAPIPKPQQDPQPGPVTGGSSGSADPAPAAAANRFPRGGFVLRPSVGDHWDRVEAATLVPKVQGCSVSIHSGASWIVTYRKRASEGKKSESHTWGPKAGLTHKEALQACLRWVWSVHEQDCGQSCPFAIDEL